MQTNINIRGVMENKNINIDLPPQSELLKIAEGVIEKYADALGELA